VEAITGLAFLMVFWHIRAAVHADLNIFLGIFLHGAIFFALLISISVIDLDLMIIPDELSLGGTLVGLGFAFWVGDATAVSWQEAAMGAFISAGLLWFIAFTYRIVRNREGMGMGDVKLMALLGAFLGIKSIPFIIFASALQGSLLAILWLVFSGEDDSTHDEGEAAELPDPDGDLDESLDHDGVGGMAIPFGPFLALAGAEWYFLSDLMIEWNPFLAYVA